MKLENRQGITNIVMKPKAICFCPLGDDWYTNEFEVTFVPNLYFPDYCDIESFLNKEIRGKSMIIENAVNALYEYLEANYEPKELTVTSYVNDVTSHSPVVVTKK